MEDKTLEQAEREALAADLAEAPIPLGSDGWSKAEFRLGPEEDERA